MNRIIHKQKQFIKSELRLKLHFSGAQVFCVMLMNTSIYSILITVGTESHKLC